MGKFIVTQMAAVAELEAGLISKRTNGTKSPRHFEALRNAALMNEGLQIATLIAVPTSREAYMAKSLTDQLADEVGAQKAKTITDFIHMEETLIRMHALSDHGIPPVAEVGRFLAEGEHSGRLSDFAKALIGKLVRDAIFERFALVPGRKARVPPPNIFSSGALYVLLIASKAAA
jgi:hypothetical protein